MPRTTLARSSPIDVPHHGIEAREYGNEVAQQVTRRDERRDLQVDERRPADVAAPRTSASVRRHEVAELTARTLDGAVHLARRNMRTVGVELEVMDDGFHRHRQPV